MSKSIKIADDIYEFVQSKAIPFEDDFNSALRRILGLKKIVNGDGGLLPSELEIHLLKALDLLGGSAKKKEVIGVIEKLNVLGPEDLRKGSRTKIWMERLGHARNSLVEEGDLSSNSRVGVWDITNKGRARLRMETSQ